MIWIASKKPDLVVDPPDAPITELPRAGDVAVTGLYFILPIVILIWCIIVERLSPALSALWATVAMIIVMLTQDALKAFFRGTGQYWRRVQAWPSPSGSRAWSPVHAT